MILPIDDTAPVSDEPDEPDVAAVGGDVGLAVAAGTVPAAAEAAEAEEAEEAEAFMMSSARISPPAPDPLMRAMSTPCSRARRRALGEIFAPATDAGSGTAAATGAAAAAGAESILRPVCCGAPDAAGT